MISGAQAGDPGDPADGVASPDTRPLIAVLPFRIHSSKPLTSLGDSLAEQVRQRLAADEEVQVLSASAVSRLVGSEPLRDSSDAALREIARELGVAYVITGSLTELAGSFSLDVRVAPAAAGLRPHTLVLTADNDGDLLARLDELSGRLVEHVVGAEPVVVTEVEIQGAPDYQEGVRGRLRTREGEAYDPAALRDDLAMLRADPALASAAAQTERGPDGVVVRFQLVATELIGAGSGAQGANGRVADVEVRGNRRIDSAAIRARIATRAGDPYRTAQIAKDVKEIFGLGFFKNVRVFSEPGDQGRVVIFEVEENPVVQEISISGNDNIESDTIRDILTLTTGSTLDEPLVYENRARIEAQYRAEGYYLAGVQFEIEPRGEGSVAIHFEVDENKKLKLRDIVFLGNEYFSDSELRQGFRTKPWRFWSYATSYFDKSGTYSEPLFIQDLQSVEKRYNDAGFLRVEIEMPPKVMPSEEGLDVEIEITEGPIFHAGTIDVNGDATVDLDLLRSKLLLREGDVFNRSFLTEDVAQLTQHYTDRGFYFASVTPLTSLDEEAQRVDVVFEVQKGPLYFIRNVEVAGNTRTVDSVVRREMDLVEGQLYSQRAILLSRAKVQSLGFFEGVDFKMEPTEDPDQLDLKVSVVERPTGSFSFGAGFSSQDNFVVDGSLSETNLFGRGYQAQLTVQYGGDTQRFFFSFTDPRAFGSTFSLGTTIFSTEFDFEDFRQSQLGIDLVLGHSLSEDNRTRGFVRYSFASRDIIESNDAFAAAVIFRELFQDDLTSSQIGLSFASDTRDDRFAPTSGRVLGAALEYAGMGFFSNFVRVEARGTWYLGAPRWLLDRSTFAVSARLGYALPFNTIADYDLNQIPSLDVMTDDGNLLPLGDIDDDIKLPLSERYFLGGLGQFQLRGFKARSVGPRRAILYREPFTGEFIPVGRRLALRDPNTGDLVFPADVSDLDDLMGSS